MTGQVWTDEDVVNLFTSALASGFMTACTSIGGLSMIDGEALTNQMINGLVATQTRAQVLAKIRVIVTPGANGPDLAQSFMVPMIKPEDMPS